MWSPRPPPGLAVSQPNPPAPPGLAPPNGPSTLLATPTPFDNGAPVIVEPSVELNGELGGDLETDSEFRLLGFRQLRTPEVIQHRRQNQQQRPMNVGMNTQQWLPHEQHQQRQHHHQHHQHFGAEAGAVELHHSYLSGNAALGSLLGTTDSNSVPLEIPLGMPLGMPLEMPLETFETTGSVGAVSAVADAWEDVRERAVTGEGTEYEHYPLVVEGADHREHPAWQGEAGHMVGREASEHYGTTENTRPCFNTPTASP